MSVCATAKRRRRQAKMMYRHMAPLDRPKYKRSDSAASQKRLREVIEKQKMIAMRKGASKK